MGRNYEKNNNQNSILFSVTIQKILREVVLLDPTQIKKLFNEAFSRMDTSKVLRMKGNS